MGANDRAVLADMLTKLAGEEGFPFPITGSFFDENVVNVRIFWNDLNFFQAIEDQAYTFGSFLGEVGGMMGLFVGMSILSIAEVLEWLFFGGRQKACGSRKSTNAVPFRS